MENERPFPKTLLEAVKYFSDPDTALGCMVAIRWPDGITCPRCESEEAFLREDTPHLDLCRMQKAFQREDRNDHGRLTYRS